MISTEQILAVGMVVAVAAPVVVPAIADYLQARQRANHVKQIIDTAMDYDFARDTSAGRESTEYKEKEA